MQSKIEKTCDFCSKSHIGEGGWQWTNTSPTGSGRERSSPNETIRVVVQPLFVSFGYRILGRALAIRYFVQGFQYPNCLH